MTGIQLTYSAVPAQAGTHLSGRSGGCAMDPGLRRGCGIVDVASPGLQDSYYLFQRFIEMMKAQTGKSRGGSRVDGL